MNDVRGIAQMPLRILQPLPLGFFLQASQGGGYAARNSRVEEVAMTAISIQRQYQH